MAARRVPKPLPEDSVKPPATTPEARENQLISLAYDLAEQQLRDGTASAQVLAQLLRSGSTRDALEKAKMDHEVELLKVKGEMLESAKHVEELYGQALNAMRAYGGHEPLSMGDEEFND